MTTLAPKLQALLESLPPAAQLDFFRFWEAIYSTRFTGPVVVNCFNGVPKQINLGQPIQLSICSGESPEGLDAEKDRKAG